MSAKAAVVNLYIEAGATYRQPLAWKADGVLVDLSGGTTETLTTENKIIEILEVGKQGPPGRNGSGGPGGSAYEHTQSLPAMVWTVAHNLDKFPSVTVTTHLGVLLLADVKYIDRNILQVEHSTAIRGMAYCN